MSSKIIFTLLIAFGFYQWLSNNTNDSARRYGEPHNKLIMYSLTTCGYCKQKVIELKKENISFTEYFIDKDQKKQLELTEKLTQAGFKPKRFGTPIFDAHGVMLPNNPKMSLIKSTLKNN